MKCPVNRGGLRFYLVIFSLAATQLAPTAGSLRGVICYGAPLVLLGVALHLWAKGCLHQDREVTASGPYRFVRHPFYVANALIDSGIAVMSCWWPWAILLPIWWLSVYVPVMRGEEAYLTSLYGDKYIEYKKRVWMFVPLGRPLASAGPGFTWRNPNITAGSEIPRDLRLAAYIPLFVAALGARTEGGAFFTGAHGLYLAAAIAFVVLHAAARLVAGRVKRGGTLFGAPIDHTMPTPQ